MKCINCGSEWNNNNHRIKIIACPFCGHSLSEEYATDGSLSVGEVVKLITEQFGVEIIQDSRKFLSIFSDYAPMLKREKKILSIALSEGIGEIVVSCNHNDVNTSIQKIKRTLEMIMSDTAINMIIIAFGEAFNWHYELSSKHIEIEETEDTENSAAKTKEGVDKHPRICPQNVDNVSNNYVNKVSKEEFLNKLTRCFFPLYSDMYLLIDVCIADDPSIKREWFEQSFDVAKTIYARNIDDTEHVFLLRQSEKAKLKFAVTKSKLMVEQQLECGFLLTDQRMYIDDVSKPIEIPITDIISFDVKYEPSSKQYLLILNYQTGSQNMRRYLIRSGSKICMLKDCLNSFLEKYKKYKNKII